MTLKELAHAAQRHLQTRAGCAIKRSHVHELLVAAFGYQSWAAFLSQCVLADAGVGTAPDGPPSLLIGRAVQLGYEQSVATEIAGAMLAFIAKRQIAFVRWSELAGLLSPPPARAMVDDELEDDEDDEAEDWEADDDAEPAVQADAQIRDRLLKSPLLLNCLEQAAEGASAERHHILAAFYRCGRPNPYLYEESIKGRRLTVIEQRWADEYLRLKPQFQKYEHHLKAAALGGVRQAAVECAAVFESQEFFELAERLSGDVDAERMAQIATTPEARSAWLRKAAEARSDWLRQAAEQGSQSALRRLAGMGARWAQERLAEQGDRDALRTVATGALDEGDALRAWTWQYLALRYEVDLTKSTMNAYHDGGMRNGEFYDSDFGGPLYVAGDEALPLPAMSPAEHREARALAQAIYGRAP